MSLWVGGILLLSFNVCLFICVCMWWWGSPILQCCVHSRRQIGKELVFSSTVWIPGTILRLGGKGLYPPSRHASLLWFLQHTSYTVPKSLSYCSIENNSVVILSHHESSSWRDPEAFLTLWDPTCRLKEVRILELAWYLRNSTRIV